MVGKVKKGIAAVAVAASVGVGHDQLRTREYVSWIETAQGPQIIKKFEARKLTVNAMTVDDTHVEENITFTTQEYDPSLAAKLLETAKAFLMKLTAADLSCSPKPTPTPVPTPTPTPTPVPPPPVGTEVADEGYKKVKFDEANAALTSTAKIRVCVIDTGIDLTHPDLPRPVAQMDFTGAGVQDNFGHGTHCAGIIAAVRNEFGVRGGAYKNVDLLVARVLGANGQGSMDGIANGMKWCAQNGAKVVSMSLGSSQGSSLMQQMVAFLDSQNIQTIMANGNDRGPVGSPARYGNKITSFAIAATTNTDAIAAFTSHGPETAFSAPGMQINSTVPRSAQMCNGSSGYCFASGTSMATPFVAANCALHLLKGYPNCSTMKVGFTGDPGYYGVGRIDALASVQ